MKKSIISSELTPPEKEELIRLRAAIVKEIREKGYRLKHLLKAIGIAKSTYYFEISKGDVVANRNNEMMKLIKEIFDQNKGTLWNSSSS